MQTEITRLRAELASGGREPKLILADIRRLEDEALVAKAEESRREAERLRELIEKTRRPIEGYEKKYAESCEREEQAAKALKAAQEEYDAAQRAVTLFEHRIKDANRLAAQYEIALSQHLQESRKALAA